MCHSGNVDTIKVLIEAGASLEAVGWYDFGPSFRYTPLLLAIFLGDVDKVEALLEGGASLEAANVEHELTPRDYAEHDLTPREFAAKLLAEDQGNADVLKALIDAEADAFEEARDAALRAIRDALK